VTLSRLVGPGFTWLAGGIAAGLGLSAFAVAETAWASVSVTMAALGLALARTPRRSGIFLCAAAIGYLMVATSVGGLLLASTATLALGGVTGEMALGHWYLVDPRLPRSSLRLLALVGIVGLIADAGALLFVGDLAGSGAVLAFWTLLVSSILLMLGVIGALRHPAYSGVMAATGLSYLAVLTTLGAVFLGRALVAGIGPFAN
jgi:hypothetical protein